MIASRKNGFTLIELIVVMAIMSVLIVITASSFQSSRIKGKDAKRKVDLDHMQKALETYLNDHKVYPASQGGAIVACGADGTSVCAYGSPFMDENDTIYMSQLPQDPSHPTIQYFYVSSTDGRRYQLYTYLENDQDKSITSFVGKNCPDVNYACNFGVSSPNTTPQDILE